MVSRRLARLLKKHFSMTDPETALGILGGCSAEGLPPEAAAVLAHMREFLEAVDEGYREFDDRLKIAVRNLDISSEELNAINLEMERLNVTTNAMMESLGQGLLFFNAKGICSPVHSKACLTLLESDPSNRHIADVLNLGEEERKDFEPLIGLLFDADATALSFDDIIALAPQYYRHSHGLTVALSYKAMLGASGAVRGVLLVATDITQKLEAQQKLKDKEEQVLRTLRIAGNRSSYVHFLHAIQAVVTTMEGASSLLDIKRDLHTLKGMSNVFYLHDFAKLLHEIEDRLGALPENAWQTPFGEIVREYGIRLELGLEYARWLGREIWGMGFESAGDVISVDTRTLSAFADDLREMIEGGRPDAAAAERLFFERVASQSVFDLLAFFETQLGYFAETADRQIRVVHEESDPVRIFPDPYRGFFDSLTHVARNIVDHAFEPAPLRELLGKPPGMQVRIRTRYEDGRREKFSIVIADDGQGISFDKVTKRMREGRRGAELEGKSREDVIQHVFDPDFSTRESVTMGSGRGTGMNVVKAEVEALGGNLRLSSEEGRGTILTITLPLIWSRQGG